MDRHSVLFLCTGNSARSQMAEALLRHHASDRFDVFSAGLRPRPVHPMTHRVMDEIGIDTSGQSSKPISQFFGKRTIQYAIVVCEQANQNCPRLYPFALHVLYWPFDDPVAFVGSEAEQLEEFRRVRDQIDARIQAWIEELTEASIQS